MDNLNLGDLFQYQLLFIFMVKRQLLKGHPFWETCTSSPIAF